MDLQLLHESDSAGMKLALYVMRVSPRTAVVLLTGHEHQSLATMANRAGS